ncbi:MAG: DUF4345 family protein [Gemmatimonadales bacterium]
MIWPRVILWLLATGFAGFGVAYAGWPAAMSALTGIALPTSTARIDFAATYGGVQLGLATFLGLCARAREKSRVRSGLLASACVLLGLVIVRVVGLLSAASAGTVIYLGLTIELIGAALALWAVLRISTYGSNRESGSR